MVLKRIGKLHFLKYFTMNSINEYIYLLYITTITDCYYTLLQRFEKILIVLYVALHLLIRYSNTEIAAHIT